MASVSAPAAASPAPAVAGRDRTSLLLAGLVLVAAALRLPQLGQSLFGDELFAYDEVAGRSFAGMLDAVLHGAEVTPPLYFCLAWVAAQLGDPVTWLRAPSLLAGLALVPVAFALARAFGARRPAPLLAAAFCALSPHLAFFGVEARPYATLALFAALSTLTLLRALDTGARGWWAAYAACSLAAAATHLTAIFVLGAQALWVLIAHREAIRPLLVANAAAAVLFAPWLTRLRRDDVGWLLNLYGGFDPSPREFADELAHLLWGYRFVDLATIPGVVASVVCGAALAALAVSGALALRRRRPAPRTILLAVLPVAVVAGLFANSAISDRDLVSERNMTSALPYVAVLFGLLAARLPRRAGAPAAVAVLGVLALGSVQALGEAGQRPRYREAATYVERVAGPRDVVLERLIFPAFGEFGRPLTRHLEIQLDPRLEHVRDTRGESEGTALAAAEARGGRVLLVQPSAALPAALGPFRLTARRVWPGIEPVAVGVYAR